MRLALFYNPHSDKPYVGDDLTEKYCEDMVRTSEWVDVDFSPLSIESRQLQMARLEATREAARQRYERQMALVNQQAEALS